MPSYLLILANGQYVYQAHSERREVKPLWQSSHPGTPSRRTCITTTRSATPGTTSSPRTAAPGRAVSRCAQSAPDFVSRATPARGMSFPTTGRSILHNPHARLAQGFSQEDHVYRDCVCSEPLGRWSVETDGW